jgi:hypothetical protein
MQESYSERLAIYTGPESCGVGREDSVEALTGGDLWSGGDLGICGQTGLELC